MTRNLLLFATLLVAWGCSQDDFSIKPVETKIETVFDPAEIEYGSIVDSRDGQLYKTVNINGRWWMAQNLNYAADSTYCYDDEPDSCTVYGRLYPWIVAMNLDPAYNKLNATYDEKNQRHSPRNMPRRLAPPQRKRMERDDRLRRLSQR